MSKTEEKKKVEPEPAAEKEG